MNKDGNTSSGRDHELEEYVKFLKFQSISAKHANIRETAEYLRDLLRNLGAESSLMETDGHPVVYGNLNLGKERTLLVYNHYDVQPVDPLDEWNHDPFSAEMEGGRIYARGSSDNKGTLMARYFGIKRALDANEIGVNIKFLYEGEEEIGSPSLEKFIEKNRGILKSDAVIMEGSTLGERGRPIISLGVKGLLYVEIEDEVAKSDMHSSYSAIVPNPAWNIILPLSNLYNGQEVTMPGFYESVRELTEDEEKILESYPFDPDSFSRPFGLKYLKHTGKSDLVRWLFTKPTMNIDGFLSGYVQEGSKTITPRKAMAKLDFRLVPDQDPRKIFALLENQLRSRGFKGKIKPLGREYPVRTSPVSKLAVAMTESARSVYGKEPIIMINSPGTQPMALFTRNLGIEEAVSAIGVGDQNSRAHAPDESIAVENYFLAIEHTKAFLKSFR